MTAYKFTQDWFHWAPEVWVKLKPLLPARKSFLEIGSFEGRSAVWMVENFLENDSELVCVDTWEGSEEHKAGEADGAEERFDYNLMLAKSAPALPYFELTKIKAPSYKALTQLAPTYVFDFVYVDGSHIAKDVLTDACLVWPMVKAGGFLVFDDYAWGSSRDILHRPKMAIDAFVNLFAEELSVIHVGYQLVVRKN
jgi:predicted O-methyltransferase YrrM